MSDEVLTTHARALLDLGADVPMCLLSRPVRAQGVGEKLRFIELPSLPAVLVNPRVPVSTPDVFAALENKFNPPMAEDLPAFETAEVVTRFLEGTRNDLEAPARTIVPAIGDVLNELRKTDGCRLARMSGSGATCFALYSRQSEAGDAATLIRTAHPDWWVADCTIGDQRMAAMPRNLS